MQLRRRFIPFLLGQVLIATIGGLNLSMSSGGGAQLSGATAESLHACRTGRNIILFVAEGCVAAP